MQLEGEAVDGSGRPGERFGAEHQPQSGSVQPACNTAFIAAPLVGSLSNRTWSVDPHGRIARLARRVHRLPTRVARLPSGRVGLTLDVLQRSLVSRFTAASSCATSAPFAPAAPLPTAASRTSNRVARLATVRSNAATRCSSVAGASPGRRSVCGGGRVGRERQQYERRGRGAEKAKLGSHAAHLELNHRSIRLPRRIIHGEWPSLSQRTSSRRVCATVVSMTTTYASAAAAPSRRIVACRNVHPRRESGDRQPQPAAQRRTAGGRGAARGDGGADEVDL